MSKRKSKSVFQKKCQRKECQQNIPLGNYCSTCKNICLECGNSLPYNYQKRGFHYHDSCKPVFTCKLCNEKFRRANAFNKKCDSCYFGHKKTKTTKVRKELRSSTTSDEVISFPPGINYRREMRNFSYDDFLKGYRGNPYNLFPDFSFAKKGFTTDGFELIIAFGEEVEVAV